MIHQSPGSPEHVPHVGAGDDLQAAAAHPGLEGQLQVLCAPDVEARVVIAQPPEEFSVNAEQSSGNGRGVGGGPGVNTPLVLMMTHPSMLFIYIPPLSLTQCSI